MNLFQAIQWKRILRRETEHLEFGWRASAFVSQMGSTAGDARKVMRSDNLMEPGRFK